MTGRIFAFRALLAIATASSIAAQNFTGSADYVIVGGGPAGFVLAEQLSQNPRTHVVLLEAGPDGINSSLINTPALYPEIQQYLWNYTSQPDPNLGGLAPNITQGRVFGGGTAVNGMAYCRGAASVFDEWAKLSGNTSLAWKLLLEDFKATTHYTFQPADYDEFVNTTVYGDGPLEVSRASGLTGFDMPFAKAVESALDLKEVDMTDGTGIGLDLGLETIRVSNRTRSYARNSFGSLMENRPNVQMIHDAWVQKLGFSEHTAVNVSYLNTLNNETYTIRAKEIIVSGGAINTPKLLMLSGVGPKNRLSELDIPIVADNPAIGANLYDHLFSIIELEVTDEVLTVWQWSQNATEEARAEEQYAANASGPLGWDNGLVATPNKSAITAWASLVQPEAAGHVTLRSSDYRDDPLIYSNFFGSAADKRAIMWSYRKLREIMASDELKSVVVQEIYPGANVTTDEDIWAAIQQQAYSFHHPMGTVAIGKALDSNWRLKGLKGIRVVDSSTFPSPPTCHPQADVYAIAHRAAKDIRDADGGSRGY